MNLSKLFELQRVLDEHIKKEHPVQEGENRIAKKILAFQVELGELANELPTIFKFWSNKSDNDEKSLKEFVDGIHFLLSIGLELDLTEISLKQIDTEQTRLKTIGNCFSHSADLNFLTSGEVSCYRTDLEEVYIDLFSEYVLLGELSGFSENQIEQAYLEKNDINHQRQEQGY